MEALPEFLVFVLAIIVCVAIVGTYERVHSINKKMDGIKDRLDIIIDEFRKPVKLPPHFRVAL
jgi:hypothetical protein